MKTVSLVYGYSARNAGDFAITLGAIDSLLAAGFRVRVFSRYRKGQRDFRTSSEALRNRYGSAIEIEESPFSLDRSDGKLQTLASYVDGALVMSGLRRKTAFRKKLLDADLVVFNGGNLFRCHSLIDFTRLCALMYPLRVACSAGKPVVIFPQSASRLNAWGRRLLLPVLKKSRLTFFRENLSFEYMRGFLSSVPLLQTIDLAFFIDKKHLPTPPIACKGKVLLTLRFHSVGDISIFTKEKIMRIFAQLEALVSEIKKERELAVIVQTDKDEALSKVFAQRNQLPLYKTNDVTELLSIYRSADLLIGMRLHSIILALSVGTPCAGLFYKEWGLKNPGMMEAFRMPYQMMDESEKLDSFSEEVNSLLAHRDKYSKAILEKVANEEHCFTDNLKEIYITENHNTNAHYRNNSGLSGAGWRNAPCSPPAGYVAQTGGVKFTPSLCDYKTQSRLGQLKLILREKGVHIEISHPALRFVYVVFCKLLRKKVFMTVHYDLGRHGRFKNALDDLSLWLCDVPFVLNEKSFRKACRWNKHTRLVSAFLPPSEDELSLSAEQARLITEKRKAGYAIYVTNASKRAFLTTGEEIYGIDFLIAFFAGRSKDFLIVSDPLSHYATRYRTNCPPNVHFIEGEHPFPALVKEADFVLRATATDGDSLSVKEGLYLHKRVICTDCVSRPAGVFLFRYGQTESLEKAIREASAYRGKINLEEESCAELTSSVYQEYGLC